jgi:hypothetical protein
MAAAPNIAIAITMIRNALFMVGSLLEVGHRKSDWVQANGTGGAPEARIGGHYSLLLPMVSLLLTIYLNCSGHETAMALTIICLTGPHNSGKTSSIREFTATHLTHLKYAREAKRDVLGVFEMPRRWYAVGVNGSGDKPDLIRHGVDFLKRYKGLRVIIVSCRTDGMTLQAVESIAKEAKVRPDFIETKKLADPREWDAAIRRNVSKIKRLMPPA